MDYWRHILFLAASNTWDLMRFGNVATPLIGGVVFFVGVCIYKRFEEVESTKKRLKEACVGLLAIAIVSIIIFVFEFCFIAPPETYHAQINQIAVLTTNLSSEVESNKSLFTQLDAARNENHALGFIAITNNAYENSLIETLISNSPNFTAKSVVAQRVDFSDPNLTNKFLIIKNLFVAAEVKYSKNDFTNSLEFFNRAFEKYQNLDDYTLFESNLIISEYRRAFMCAHNLGKNDLAGEIADESMITNPCAESAGMKALYYFWIFKNDEGLALIHAWYEPDPKNPSNLTGIPRKAPRD